LVEEAEVEDAGASEPGSATSERPAPEEPPPKKHKPQAEEVPPSGGPTLPVISSEAPAGVAGATGETTRGPGSVSPAASTPEGPPLKRSKMGAESNDNGTKESPDWSQDEEPPDWSEQFPVEDEDTLRRRRVTHASVFLG